MRLLIFSLIFACSPKWKSVADCEKETEVGLADSCYGEILPELFRTDPDAADALTQERIQDSMVRDFVYLTVTREIDPSTYRWCERMAERVLIERCRVIVGRPHLHEALKIEASGGSVKDMTHKSVVGDQETQKHGGPAAAPTPPEHNQGKQGKTQPVRSAPPPPQ